MTVQPSKYTIKVRDASLNLIGEIDEFQKLAVALRYNAWGTWELTLDKSHPMAAYLATPGYGLYVVRNGTVLFSGPMNMPHRKFDSSGDLLIASGYTDEVWLAKRDAWPVTNFPYSNMITTTSGIVLYYRLDETSGTTAHDTANAENGTYVGSPTLNVTGAIDDTDTAITLNGTSQYVTFPVISTPTGNHAWSLECWVNPAAYGAGNVWLVGFGTNAAKSTALLYMNSSGQIQVTGNSWGDTGGATLPIGSWSHVVGTWDGTSLKCYVNGVQTGSTTTPGAMTIGATAAAIGAVIGGGGNYLHGSIDEVAVYTSALSAATILQHYDIGISRFALQAADIYPTSGTTDAESVLQHFVNVNAGPGAIPSRQTTGLTLGTNNHNGGSTSAYTARFDDLLASDLNGLLQQVANAAGVGFHVLQSGTGLQFSVYVPTDRSAYAIFSQDLGNLVSFDYASEGPDPETGGNMIVIGGAGDGTARTFYLIEDSTSVTNWGRAETFFDQRNTSTIAQLAQTAADQLTKDAGTTSFTATLLATEALEFQTSTSAGSNIFNLGDKVTAIIDGASYSDYVREIDITVDSQGGEIINPVIGTPTTKMLRFALDSYSRTLKRTTRIVKQLQRAQ